MIENYPDMAAMEIEGNYDAKTPDGDLQYAPRWAIAKEFFQTHPDKYYIIGEQVIALPGNSSEACYIYSNHYRWKLALVPYGDRPGRLGQ